MLKDIDYFHRTPWGYVTFGVVELALGYAVAIRAIDTANLWFYAIATILIVGGISNFVRLAWNHIEFVHKHPHPHATKKKHPKKA